MPTIIGTSGNDTLTGTINDDVINGYGGNDTIDAGWSNDTIDAGDGDDVVQAGDGDDSITDGAGSDTIYGGAGTDTIYASVGAGNDVYDGGDNPSYARDFVDYSAALAGVIVNLNLASNQAQSFGSSDAAGIGVDNLVNVEGIIGTSFADTLIGNSGDNSLVGRGGDDALSGGDGRDNLAGGDGNDTMDGGTGSDTGNFAGSANGVTVSLMVNGAQNTGQGVDTLTNIEHLIGSYYNDILTGNDDANTLRGVGGDDQLIGGGGADYLDGYDGNDYLDGGTGADEMDGFIGNDTYVVDDAGDVIYEDFDGELGGVDTVLSSVSRSAGNNIENLTLTGSADLNGSGNLLANVLIGNSGVNTLEGYAGNDSLDGGAGADTLVGGQGDDTYVVDDSGDVTTELTDEGIDTVISSVSRSAGANIENLTLTGSADLNGFGNSLANILIGNSGANELDAGSGDDTIDGAGGNDNLQGWDGSDILHGGTGNDELLGGAGDDLLDGGAGIDTATYITASAGVVVSLATAGAQDTVAEGTDTLIAVENLIGSHYADRLTGDAAANSLSGLSGNDFLIGGGGADSLDGGDDGDVYVIASAADHGVAEFGDTGIGGADEVRFVAAEAGTLKIFAGDTGIERVVTGSGTGAVADTSGTLALNIDASAALNALIMTGNAGDNILTATAFNDTLNGGLGIDRLYGNAGDDLLDGGVGADKLFGGLGDDIYVVDHGSDIVVEYAGEGVDTVQASVNHTLRDNVENIVLTGIYSIYANGNALDNQMTGNSGANKLYGLGGADTLVGLDGSDTLDGGTGADTMTGGAGNEQYYVDNAGDQTIELANEGIDTVRSTIDVTLAANVENAVLLGTANIGATGNGLNNVMTGNAGDNQFIGGAGVDQLKGLDGNDTLDGGVGSDRLYGGTGDDSYVVDTSGDLIFENAGEGIDTVQSSSTFVLAANVENLELTGSANLNGTGNGEDNLLSGNDGANILYGGLGQDGLNGNGGADVLKGEDGNDSLTGGAARDRFYGGTGADQFIFNDGDFAGLTSSTSDQIHDFSQAEGDIIRLDGVDANAGLAGDQGFSFIGSGAFSHTAGELRYAQISGNTYVQGDTDGDGQADFWIRLDGLHALAVGDFVL